MVLFANGFAAISASSTSMIEARPPNIEYGPKGKHITIFAHHPPTVKLLGRRFSCTALLRQRSSKNSVGLETLVRR